MLHDRVYDFWLNVICNSSRAESERDWDSYVIYHKGIITLIRELGVNEDVCARLWDSVLLIGNNMFNC